MTTTSTTGSAPAATMTASIFGKLDLPPSDDDHRRVMAVLAWLRG